MCMCPQYIRNSVPGGLSDLKIIDMNNVGTISQLLYAHQNSEYDKVKASGWQAAQVSLLSLMSFSGRFSIGKSFQKAYFGLFIRINLLHI
jgi:hypothetical protein